MSSKKQLPAPKLAPVAERQSEALPLVLVVDDEELIRRTFARALTGLPLRVITAPDALRALAVLRRETVAVVLSDQRMPGPQGVDLLDTVRVRWPGVRRILMSAVLDHELALRARHHRVLQKSMSFALLRDIIEQEARRAG
jgi:DNA-binding NtrC family response regulator